MAEARRKLTVLVDARVPLGSGIGRYYVNVLKVMREAQPEIRARMLVSRRDEGAIGAMFAEDEGVEVIGSDAGPFSLVADAETRALARSCDLTWFTNYWVPFRWPGRIVATVHDLIHIDRRIFDRGPLHRLLARLMFWRLSRVHDGIVFISRFTEREFSRRFGAARRRRVIYHGVDHFERLARGVEAGGKMEKENLILAVSSPKKHKNAGVLIEAWRLVEDKRGWRLAVVSPEALPDFVTEADGVSARVAISDEELARLWLASKATAFPSLHEGFGFPLLEAACCRSVCILSDAKALTELSGRFAARHVVAEDAEGWAEQFRALIEAGEADEQALRADAEANAKRVKEFTWRRSAEATADFLREAAGR